MGDHDVRDESANTNPLRTSPVAVFIMAAPSSALWNATDALRPVLLTVTNEHPFLSVPPFARESPE